MSPRSPSMNPKPLSVNFLIVPCGIPPLPNKNTRLRRSQMPSQTTSTKPVFGSSINRKQIISLGGRWQRTFNDNTLSPFSGQHNGTNFTPMARSTQIKYYGVPQIIRTWFLSPVDLRRPKNRRHSVPDVEITRKKRVSASAFCGIGKRFE
jgi:hypothetical protein